jgi:DNA mismatch endonuclease, patch repair protein
VVRPMKVPRFDGLVASSEAASRIKKRVRAADTRAELALRKALTRLGCRYRVRNQQLPGKPDITFRGRKVAVFVDGDYWHGRNWSDRRTRLSRGANSHYWLAKIESNIARDVQKSAALRSAGWRVIRLWESDILKNPEMAARRVQAFLRRTNR